MIKLATDAGFKLKAKSEINANPKDTKDYEKGVWTLPPTYTLGDKDRDKYAAIGESDRMTLKFVKPAGDEIFQQGQDSGGKSTLVSSTSPLQRSKGRPPRAAVFAIGRRMLILFNKPYGVLCQFTDRSNPPKRTLAEFVRVPNVYPAGRLDFDSEGLLVLTDDGALAHRLTDPRHKLAKSYSCRSKERPTKTRSRACAPASR